MKNNSENVSRETLSKEENNKYDPTEVFFICDPDKATTCKKTICYKNGGECRLTLREDWAKKRFKSRT